MGLCESTINNKGIAVIRRGTIAGVVCALTISGTASVHASDAPGKAAFHVRALQTELMIAALSCEARAHYNDFATKFQNVLIKHGRALKARFHQAHGRSAGEKKLNAYVTALANKTSSRQISEGDKYCARAMRTFAQLSAMPLENFSGFAQKRTYAQNVVPASFMEQIQVVNRKQ
jgi:hypothetical protein